MEVQVQPLRIGFDMLLLIAGQGQRWGLDAVAARPTLMRWLWPAPHLLQLLQHHHRSSATTLLYSKKKDDYVVDRLLN
jgi:hypothetical protein